MVANAIGALAGTALSLFGSHKSAEDSSALQYKYQTMLNQQNYNYNTKLINQQNAFNERMMDKANDWNLARWNESVNLANTAHQREIADLKSAGLNPILSANGGASVVNPIQSAQASSGNSQLSSSAGMPDVDYIGALQSASQMYQQNRQVNNELKNSRTTRAFTNANTYKALVDANVNQANSSQQIALQKQQVEEIKNKMENENRMTDANIKKIESDIMESASRRDLNSAYSWRARHQSLGYSESETTSESKDYSPIVRSYKVGPIGGTWVDNDNTSNKYSRSYTRSRTY